MNLPIASPSVSRVHAEIIGQHDLWQVLDLGSTNGTYVNGRRIKDGARLTPDDLVQFSDVPFRVGRVSKGDSSHAGSECVGDRIGGLLAPDAAFVDSRSTARYSRCVPVLLVPWEEDSPNIDQATFGVSKDLSRQGMGLIVAGECRAKMVVVGVWELVRSADGMAPVSDPTFLLATVRHTIGLGAGSWQLGLQFVEAVESPETLAALRPLAERLLPGSSCPSRVIDVD